MGSPAASNGITFTISLPLGLSPTLIICSPPVTKLPPVAKSLIPCDIAITFANPAATVAAAAT